MKPLLRILLSIVIVAAVVWVPAQGQVKTYKKVDSLLVYDHGRIIAYKNNKGDLKRDTVYSGYVKIEECEYVETNDGNIPKNKRKGK